MPRVRGLATRMRDRVHQFPDDLAPYAPVLSLQHRFALYDEMASLTVPSMELDQGDPVGKVRIRSMRLHAQDVAADPIHRHLLPKLWQVVGGCFLVQPRRGKADAGGGLEGPGTGLFGQQTLQPAEKRGIPMSPFGHVQFLLGSRPRKRVGYKRDCCGGRCLQFLRWLRIAMVTVFSGFIHNYRNFIWRGPVGWESLGSRGGRSDAAVQVRELGQRCDRLLKKGRIWATWRHRMGALSGGLNRHTPGIVGPMGLETGRGRGRGGG